jgi:hypothetical protein
VRDRVADLGIEVLPFPPNATRSALNTAKLIEENPTLMRLKELEALEKVTEKVEKLTVFGGLDGLLNQLVKLR